MKTSPVWDVFLEERCISDVLACGKGEPLFRQDTEFCRIIAGMVMDAASDWFTSISNSVIDYVKKSSVRPQRQQSLFKITPPENLAKRKSEILNSLSSKREEHEYICNLLNTLIGEYQRQNFRMMQRRS
jgi:hypothetical protein